MHLNQVYQGVDVNTPHPNVSPSFILFPTHPQHIKLYGKIPTGESLASSLSCLFTVPPQGRKIEAAAVLYHLHIFSPLSLGWSHAQQFTPSFIWTESPLLAARSSQGIEMLQPTHFCSGKGAYTEQESRSLFRQQKCHPGDLLSTEESFSHGLSQHYSYFTLPGS